MQAEDGESCGELAGDSKRFARICIWRRGRLRRVGSAAFATPELGLCSLPSPRRGADPASRWEYHMALLWPLEESNEAATPFSVGHDSAFFSVRT